MLADRIFRVVCGSVVSQGVDPITYAIKLKPTSISVVLSLKSSKILHLFSLSHSDYIRPITTHPLKETFTIPRTEFGLQN